MSVLPAADEMDVTMDNLDRSILDWIAAHTDSAALHEQIRQAWVVRRDYTRTGYFIYLRVPDTLPLLPVGLRPNCPDISAPALRDGAGTNLFVRSGKIHYLEIYARGGFFPEQPMGYSLIDPA